MTKHAFPAYAFREQKKYLLRHLVKPRSMKLRSFISRLQEGQGNASLLANKIMDIIYHSIPTTWKNKKIEQGFIYADSTIKEMTDFFETREET